MDIAKLAREVVLEQFENKKEIEIITTESDDNRSYHINSDKIKKSLGFEPRFNIKDAIKSLCVAFKEGKIKNSMDDDIYYNIRTMKKLKIK